MGVSRREFLKVGLVGTAAVALAPDLVNRYIYDYAVQKYRKPMKNPDLDGTFKNLVLPKELIPQKDFWKKIFAHYGYEDMVLYTPEDFKIRGELKLNKRGEKISRQQSNLFRQKVKSLKKKYENVRAERGQRDDLEIGIQRAAPFWNHCVRKFELNGVSGDLAYVAYPETCFNPDARSRAKALGAYQFIYETGIHFLQISKKSEGFAIEARLDPILEAEATALLSKANYARYGDPRLALIIFQAGKGNGDRLKIFMDMVSNGNPEEDFLGISTQTFPKLINWIRLNGKRTRLRGSYGFISSQYLPSFFGVKEGVEEGFDLSILKDKELEFDEIALLYGNDKRISIMDVVENLNLSIEDMIKLNPAVRYLRTKYKDRVSEYLPQEYSIRVPPGDGERFMSLYGSLLKQDVEIESHRKTDPIVFRRDYTYGDHLYNKVIALRREGRTDEVTPDMLKEVRNAYYVDLASKPRDKWLLNSIKVIEFDMHELKMELYLDYPSLLTEYKGKLGRHIARNPEIIDEISDM